MENIAIKIEANIEPDLSGYKLNDEQESDIHIVGTCELRVQRPGGCWHTEIAMVKQQLADTLLLNWNTKKFLNTLPHSGPHELHTRTASLALWKLCGEPSPVKADMPGWPPPHLSSKI